MGAVAVTLPVTVLHARHGQLAAAGASNATSPGLDRRHTGGILLWGQIAAFSLAAYDPSGRS